jgi:hypothetical protein
MLQDILKDSSEMKVLSGRLEYIYSNSSFLSKSTTKSGKASYLTSERIREINSIWYEMNKNNGSKVDAN